MKPVLIAAANNQFETITAFEQMFKIADPDLQPFFDAAREKDEGKLAELIKVTEIKEVTKMQEERAKRVLPKLELNKDITCGITYEELSINGMFVLDPPATSQPAFSTGGQHLYAESAIQKWLSGSELEVTATDPITRKELRESDLIDMSTTVAEHFAERLEKIKIQIKNLDESIPELKSGKSLETFTISEFTALENKVQEIERTKTLTQEGESRRVQDEGVAEVKSSLWVEKVSGNSPVIQVLSDAQQETAKLVAQKLNQAFASVSSEYDVSDKGAFIKSVVEIVQNTSSPEDVTQKLTQHPDLNVEAVFTLIKMYSLERSYIPDAIPNIINIPEELHSEIFAEVEKLEKQNLQPEESRRENDGSKSHVKRLVEQRDTEKGSLERK